MPSGRVSQPFSHPCNFQQRIGCTNTASSQAVLTVGMGVECLILKEPGLAALRSERSSITLQDLWSQQGSAKSQQALPVSLITPSSPTFPLVLCLLISGVLLSKTHLHMQDLQGQGVIRDLTSHFTVNGISLITSR
ncbi:uncharacterized [Tachysurus ichikawai]